MAETMSNDGKYQEYQRRKSDAGLDGQGGIEFGSSGLDRDGNLDSSVHYEPMLSPGASFAIDIQIAVLSPRQHVCWRQIVRAAIVKAW